MNTMTPSIPTADRGRVLRSACIVPSHATFRGTRGYAAVQADLVALVATPKFGAGRRTWSPPTT